MMNETVFVVIRHDAGCGDLIAIFKDNMDAMIFIAEEHMRTGYDWLTCQEWEVK